MKAWDIFISHASEDKQDVAIPLASQLKRAGIKVWLDKQELRLGDSLREAIDFGLAHSRFGIVILSPSFLAKNWPRNELNGLMSMEQIGRKVILPIWHNLDQQQLASFSPILADRLAGNTSDGIEKLVRDISRVIFESDSGNSSAPPAGLYQRLSALLESESDIPAIRDFIGSHPALLSCAHNLGPWQENLILVSPKMPQFRPDFCIGAYRPSIGDHQWTIVKLGLVTSFSGEFRLSDFLVSDPCNEMEAMMKTIQHTKMLQPYNLYRFGERSYEGISFEHMPLANALLICGRRTAASQNILAALNARLDYAGIKVRTYDSLLDAAERAETFDPPQVKWNAVPNNV